MSSVSDKEWCMRIIDANSNRIREGIRVVEDIVRYCYENEGVSARLKDIRHKSESILRDCGINYADRFFSRDSLNDVGLNVSNSSEDKRACVNDVFLSNIRRATEGLRVMEEVTKIFSTDASKSYKHLRYRVYELEKEIYFIINKQK